MLTYLPLMCLDLRKTSIWCQRDRHVGAGTREKIVAVCAMCVTTGLQGPHPGLKEKKKLWQLTDHVTKPLSRQGKEPRNNCHHRITVRVLFICSCCSCCCVFYLMQHIRTQANLCNRASERARTHAPPPPPTHTHTHRV